MCTECVRGHGYECEWERSCRQRSREAERGCARSRMGEGTLGCPSFCFRERACTGTGRTGSRHAELREDTAHVQSAALSPVQSQPLTHVMPQRLWSPKGPDKCKEGGVYVKFPVANLGEKTSAALNNPAKVISWYPSLAEAGGNEEACEIYMWVLLDLQSQAPVLRDLAWIPRELVSAFPESNV